MNSRRSELLLVGALLLFGSLSFFNLMALPVFEDEGTQLRWIWRLADAGEWLQPLGDGKPLEAWPLVPAVWLSSTPVIAVRAMHVLVGMIGIVLMFRLGRALSDRWAAVASAASFAVCPFVVYLQRLALSDILLCTAGVWVLLSTHRLVESPTRQHASSWASSLVLAAFCKFPVGFIFLISMPLAMLSMPGRERQPLLRPPAAQWLLLAHAPIVLLGLTVLVVATVQWSRGASPGFGLHDLQGVGLGGYAIGAPRPQLWSELTAQLSWPVVAVATIGLLASVLQGDWRERWLIAMGVLPMLAIALFASFWFSRYLLFTLPPLIVSASCGWRRLWARSGRFLRAGEVAAFAVCLGLMGRQSALIILDPVAASWSALDRSQYFEGVGSGYGYREAASFILTAPDTPARIYSLDGHSAYQLRSYLPPGWVRRVTPVFYADDGTGLRTEESRFANLLAHVPAWLIVPEPLLHRYLIYSFGEANVARIAVRQIRAFEKPSRLTRVSIYEIALQSTN